MGRCRPDRDVLYHATGETARVARGERKLKSRLGGMIEPFTLCQLDLFENLVTRAYRIPRSPSMSHSQKVSVPISLMTAAGRMVNLVNAVMAEGDAEPRVFEMLESGLRMLLESRDAA